MRAPAWILLASSVALATAAVTARAASSRPVPAKVEILVVTRDLAAGEILRREDIATRTVPDFRTPTFVRPRAAGDLVGLRIRLPLLAGDPLLWSFLRRANVDAIYDDCQAAASEPRTASEQIARARQVVLSMERR